MSFPHASRLIARLRAASAVLLALGAVSVGTVACAHAPEGTLKGVPDVAKLTRPALGGSGLSRSASLMPAPDVKRPESRLEARGMLERAFEASAEGEHRIAVALYGAVLGTDYLTDKGRANLYWMRAESFTEISDEAGRRDSLLGFLIASDLAPSDDDIKARRLLARSVVTAMRVEEDPRFGRSPEDPISVEDLQEPASIISTLSCGPERDAHYVDVAIRSVHRDESRLVHRRAECAGDGAVLDLWFDVTHADSRR